MLPEVALASLPHSLQSGLEVYLSGPGSFLTDDAARVVAVAGADDKLANSEQLGAFATVNYKKVSLINYYSYCRTRYTC